MGVSIQFFSGLGILVALFLLSNQVTTVRTQSTEDISVTEEIVVTEDASKDEDMETCPTLPIPAAHEIPAQLANGNMTLKVILANSSTQFTLVLHNRVSPCSLAEYSAVSELSSQMRSIQIIEGHEVTLYLHKMPTDGGKSGLVYHENFDYGVAVTGPNATTVKVINFVLLPAEMMLRIYPNGLHTLNPIDHICFQFNGTVDPKSVTPVCVLSKVKPDIGFYDPSRALVLFYNFNRRVVIYSVPLSNNSIPVAKIPYKDFFISSNGANGTNGTNGTDGTNGTCGIKGSFTLCQIIEIAVVLTILLLCLGITVLCCFKRFRTRIMLINSLSESLGGASFSSVNKRKNSTKVTPSSPLSSSSSSLTNSDSVTQSSKA